VSDKYQSKEHSLLHKKIRHLRAQNEILQDSLLIERRCRKAAWETYRERTQGSFFTYIIHMLSELNKIEDKSRLSFHKRTIDIANTKSFKRVLP